MSWDLKIENGDLVFDNLGSLAYVKDEDEIIQSIKIRLNTVKGDLFYNEEYGLSPEYKRLKMKFNTLQELRAIIEDCLLDDERIAEVVTVDFIKTEYTKTLLEIVVLLTDNTLLEIQHAV